ncbi:lrrc57, partial [Symbiodinium sp. KB8]
MSRPFEPQAGCSLTGRRVFKEEPTLRVCVQVTLYLMSEHVVTKDVGAWWMDIVGCVADEVAFAANSFDTWRRYIKTMPAFKGPVSPMLATTTFPGEGRVWREDECRVGLATLNMHRWSLVRFMAEGDAEIDPRALITSDITIAEKLGHDRIYRTLATILPFYTGALASALLGAILAVSLGLVGSSQGAFGLRRALSLLGADVSRIWESNDMLAQTLSDAICIRTTPDFIHVQDYALLWVKYDQPSEEQEEDFRSLVAHENEKPSEAVAAIASLIALLFVASGLLTEAAMLCERGHCTSYLAAAMDLPLGPEKLAKMMGMSVQQMEEEFQSSWTRVAVSDVMEMRLVGDTRGLGSKPRPGPQYFPRLPNRVAEDDTWRDRGVQLVSAWFKGADYCMAHFDQWQTLWDDERK